EAVVYYQQALRLTPQNAELHTNLGNVYWEMGRFDEALASFAEAIRLDPGLVGPHHNRALLWLLLGEWSKGLPEYEWRLKTPDFPAVTFQHPRWDGSPLGERTLLLLAEQGWGDTLQFTRYVLLIQQTGGKVILVPQPPLQRLLADFPGVQSAAS